MMAGWIRLLKSEKIYHLKILNSLKKISNLYICFNMMISLGISKHRLKTQFLIDNKDIDTYPFIDSELLDLKKDVEGKSIIETVAIALDRCTTCYFVLDGIFLPLSPVSISCLELMYILDNPLLLKKVEFILDNKLITTTEALEYVDSANLNNYPKLSE